MPPSKRSTQRLSELARHVIVPSGIVSTDWPRFRNTIRGLGIGVDGWQDGIGQVTFGERADGLYAHSVGGIVTTIPRQSGKTHIFSAIAFALCVLEPDTLVLWTAHHTKTSEETVLDMAAMARLPQIAPFVKKVLTGHSDPSIHFQNGSRILFGARERGFGRGMKRVKMLMLDEAQILSEKAMSAMVATMNVIPNPLLVLAGTPPEPTDPSEVWMEKRKQALSGEHDDMFFVEFSADVDADPMDRKQWKKANPSYPHRTGDAAILRMLRNLGLEAFRREALGIYDEATMRQPVFDAATWANLEKKDPKAALRAYGVKFSPDSIALSGAQKRDDGTVWVEGLEHRPIVDGFEWLVERLVKDLQTGARVAIDGRSFAEAFIPLLKEAKIPDSKVIHCSTGQAITANGMMAIAVTDETVSHGGDPVLAASVAASGRRKIGTAGGWGLESINGGDCTLFESAVLAHFAADTAKIARAPRKLY